MITTIHIHGKAVRVELSGTAERAIARRQTPLLAEMELYFSCLIRKKVRFRDNGVHIEGAPVNHGLHVSFRPVTTAQCRLVDVEDEPPLIAMPVVNPRPFVPTWLWIDYHRGNWRGEFGLDKLRA